MIGVRSLWCITHLGLFPGPLEVLNLWVYKGSHFSMYDDRWDHFEEGVSRSLSPAS